MRHVRSGVWLEIGRSNPHAFFKATVAVIKSAQIALYVSAASFLLAIYDAVAGRHLFHAHLMAVGLLAFYFSVMYIQLPGFINAVPKRPATWLLAAAFFSAAVVSYWVGYIAYLPFSLTYAILYIKGLGGKPTYVPNLVTVPGLLFLPTAGSHLDAIASYPLASVYTLLYRIDSSKARRRFSLASSLALASTYVAAYLAFRLGHLWAFLLPSLVLTAVAPPKVRDPYGVGALAFRWAIALAGVHHHFMYMAFALVMSVLCVPYFLPSVLYRGAPTYGLELLALATIATALRLLGQITAAGVLTIATVLYVAWRLARQKPIPLP
ncbi:MAG: hypothetical protein ACK4SY_02075 [Pyrobaculum sp.]